MRNVKEALRESSVATLLSTIRDPYGTIERLHRRHGDVFPLRLPGLPPIHVVAEPTAVRQLVSGNYTQLSRFGGGVELFLGREALIFLEDEPHKRRRKLMNPPLNAESVRAFGPTMRELADRALEPLRAGQTLPLLPIMQDITLRVIIRCVFGMAEGPRLERLRTLIIDYLRAVFGPEMLALAAALTPRRTQRWLSALAARAAAAPPDADFVVSRLPVRRVADRLGRIRALLRAEIERCLAEDPTTRNDVLALMLRARFEDGQPMSHEELCEQLLMLLIGGYETTSQSLCWAMHCLLGSPSELARVRDEVTRVMGDGFDAKNVRELSYLGAVIQESMRLYPIAVGVTRELRVPMTLAGRELAVGSMVMASIYLTQRHSDLWDEPQRFRPERMLEKKPAPHLLFPFGAGAWRCLGAAFAEHEMRIVLARLCSRFELEHQPGSDVRPVHRGITIGPSDGLSVRILGRRASQRSKDRSLRLGSA